MGRKEGSQVPRQNARARLAALREEKPVKKAAQIRALWPEIKVALDTGHSLKTVCNCLEADGIIVTVQTLGSYLTRMRRKAVLPTAIRKPSVPTNDEGRAIEAGDATPVNLTDPLADAQERQRRRSAFDYRPELADPKELI